MRTLHRGTVRTTLLLVSLVVGTACGSDAVSSPPDDPNPPVSQAHGGTQSDSAGKPTTPGAPTSTNAVAGIRLAPRELTLGVGSYGRLGVVPVDAGGVPTLALLAGRPTYRTADAKIAAVGDTGVVLGAAAGTTKIYATLGTMIDSATVVVSPASGPAGAPTQRAGLHVYGPSVIATGRSAALTAILLDDKGRAVSPRALHPTWRSDDEGVVKITSTQVSDTALVALVTAVAPGRTTLRASVDGSSDTLAILVATTVDSTIAGPPTQPAPVASFDLTTVVYGGALRTTPASGDTTPVVVSGAAVTVYRLVRDSTAPNASRDTLGARVQVATGTTNASGEAVFRALTGGSYYVVAIQPPAGSPFVSAEYPFGPPRSTDYRIGFVLARKP